MTKIDTSEFTTKSLEQLTESHQNFLKRRKKSPKHFTPVNFGGESDQASKKLSMYLSVGARMKRTDINFEQARSILWKLMIHRVYNCTPQFTNHQVATIQQLIRYFLSMQCDLSLHKGIWIYGPYATGKTLIMRAFAMLTDCINYNRFAKLDYIKYLNKRKSGERDLIDQFDNMDLFIDDLGFQGERNIKVYGNEEDVLGDVVYSRYVVFQSKKKKTHVTSNLGFPLIKEMYDEGITSRIKDSFNFIEWNGPKHRK